MIDRTEKSRRREFQDQTKRSEKLKNRSRFIIIDKN